jgi:hypothetical protein
MSATPRNPRFLSLVIVTCGMEQLLPRMSPYKIPGTSSYVVDTNLPRPPLIRGSGSALSPCREIIQPHK